MPGKVDPVIPEFVIQVALEACGRQAAIRSTVDHGELDLNVWESLAVFSLLDTMRGLGTACSALSDRCFRSRWTSRSTADAPTA